MAPGILVILALIGAAPSQGPARGCPIRIVPADSAGPWLEAAVDLDRELRRSKPGERDCREVEVRTDPRAPSVAVVTTDGRRAQRPLGGVQELAPTVEGLLITVTPSAPDAPADVALPADGPAPPRRGPHLLFTTAAGAPRSF